MSLQMSLYFFSPLCAIEIQMFRLVPKDTLQAFPQSRARQWTPKQPSSHLRCSFMGKQMDLTRSPIWRFVWNLETLVLVDWHWNMLQPVSIASLARLTRKSWDHVFSISQPVTFLFFGTSDPVPGLSAPLAFSAALSNALDDSTLFFARALSLVTCKLCSWFDKGIKPKPI